MLFAQSAYYEFLQSPLDRQLTSVEGHHYVPVNLIVLKTGMAFHAQWNMKRQRDIICVFVKSVVYGIQFYTERSLYILL